MTGYAIPSPAPLLREEWLAVLDRIPLFIEGRLDLRQGDTRGVELDRDLPGLLVRRDLAGAV